MDPFTIALAALNLGGRGYNMYQGNQLARDQASLGRSQHQAEVRSANNAAAQMAEDNLRKKRMLEESLASRGVEDSTIARDDMNYLNRGQDRAMQGAADRVNLANKGLQVFNKGVKIKRHGNYLNYGLDLANALGGAYSAMQGPPIGGLAAAKNAANVGFGALKGLF